MPIDDLDQLLAMELGGAPEQRKISSLEAQVLSRVQQTHTPDDRPALAPAEEKSSQLPAATLDPIYQYTDALMPMIRTVLAHLEDNGGERDLSTLTATLPAILSALRSQLADQLLALPDVKTIDKPSLFAALATCIDAAGGQSQENRRAARERLNRLVMGLNQASRAADQERAQAIDRFAQHLSRPR